MDENNIPDDKRPDFLLTIHFKPGIKNPQRIFAAASECIESMQACDEMLLKSFRTSIKPVFLMEQVKDGSLCIWLKQFLESIDDDALKNLDWKPAVGKFLVKAKYYLLKKLEGKQSLPSREELTQISDGIHELAKETDVLKLPAYARVPEIDIAQQLQVISRALARLEKGESISMSNDDGNAVIDAEFSVSENDVKDLLTSKTLENVSEMILMVRKPDFLGDSKWVFRFSKSTMSVSISDKDWLSDFQSGGIDIRPGDALYVSLKETVSYDLEGEVISEDREIVAVHSVIRKKQQASLLDEQKTN